MGIDLESARATLRDLTREEREELLLALGRSHVGMCNITSQEQDAHADESLRRQRIAALSDETIVELLAPLAILGHFAHGHAGEHRAGGHGH